MGIKNELLVCTLGGDDVASRVGHVAEEGVEEVIYELGWGCEKFGVLNLHGGRAKEDLSRSISKAPRRGWRQKRARKFR
jgi:hypothetical protein